MKRQIFKNLASNYFASLLQIALGFLVVPFLIGKLDKEAFGLIFLAESLVAFSLLFNSSIRMAFSRYATVSLSQGNKDEFIEYLSTGRGILLICAAVALSLGLLISFYFPSIFRVPEIYADQSRLLFLMITISFAISIPNDVFWTVLYAHQRFDLINLSSSGGAILRAICIFIFYSVLPIAYVNLATYGLIYLVMTWGQNLMVFIWSKKIMPNSKISLRYFRLAKVKEIISYSGHTTLSNISVMLYENTMNIIINIFWGPSFNAIYGISIKLPTIMRRLFLEPSWALGPTFMNLASKNDKIKIETLFFTYSKAMSILTMPLFMILAVFSNEIILLWVGTGFELAAKIMPFYAMTAMIAVPVSVCGCIIGAYGTIQIPSKVAFVTAVINLVFGTVLGVVFKLGLLGIAASSLIIATVGSNVFLPFYACKVGGISHKRFWLESIFKPLLCALFFIGSGFFVARLVHPDSHSTLFLTLIFFLMCTLCYLTAYIFLLTRSEKKYISEIFGAAFGNMGISFKKVTDEAESL